MFGSYLYIFGGSSIKGLLNDLYVLDIETRRWEKIALPGPMPTPRTNHKAVLVSQSRIVIFGGFTEQGLVNDVY